MFSEQTIYDAAVHLLATSVNASYSPQRAVRDARELAAAVEASQWLANLEAQTDKLPVAASGAAEIDDGA